MTVANSNFSEILSTTIANYSNDFTDNISNHNAIFAAMKEKGNILTTGGGEKLVKQINFAENGNFQWYSGHEVLNIEANDMISAAEYAWKQCSDAVSISGLELRQNMGAERLGNLLDQRIKASMRTMMNNIVVGVYSDGTGSSGKEIGGLQLLVADDPTTGTVGGIDRATYDFWRNISYDATTDGGAAASASNISTYMNTVYNQLVFGVDKPDLIVADLNYFGFYQDSLQTQQRFTSVENKISLAGFNSLAYAGNVPVVLENSGIQSNHMYFLNTEHLFLEVHPDANMSNQGQRTNTNQDSFVELVLWQGNMTMDGGRYQGVLKD